jgi:DEAD/DEAH box helicase
LRKPTIIKIKDYLTEVQKEVFEFIDINKNILISSNPASGKTTLFAQLCIDNVSSKKNNRIVFCAPYIIIQEQFKQKLVNSEVSVDFELNGSSRRKKLNDEDRIITSTFKSFHRISQNLSSDDIVIIDEAHSLLNVFSDKKTNRHDHFGNFYKALYDTKAKIVLMTGTPVDSFYQWFDNLKELKVFSKSTKAKVNIQYSNHNDSDIVIQFAKECIEKYNKNSLNVIYVKSKNKCAKYAEIIGSLGYSGLVLTSDSKLTDGYKELVNSSIISKKYQFLITTNVISTGTNILNDNMGRALMLNEYDPIEIKQFSKRFRKKLDIEIDVVNRFQKKVDEFEDLRKQLIDKRNSNREYLSHIKLNLNTELENQDTEILNFNQFGGEASQLNPKNRKEVCLKRNLLQEIYFHQEITKTYNDRLELVKALNEFDDIISVEIQEYESNKTNYTFDEKAYQEDKKTYLHSVINSFIEQPEVYLCAFSNYIQVYQKYSSLINIKYIVDKFEITESTIEKSNDVSVNPQLLDKIISPLVAHYPLFLTEDAKMSLKRCLTFIKNVPLNKQSKHLIALWFNDKFHADVKVPENYDIENQNLIHINPLDTKNSDLIYFLLNKTFHFLMLHEEIYYQDFKNSIIKSNQNKGFYPDEFFPWHYQLTVNDGRITEIDRNFGFGLLYSIFAIKPTQVQKPHPNIKDSGRVNTILPSDLENIKELSFLNKKGVKEVITHLKPIKTLPPTYNYSSINLNEKERVIVDKNYLTLVACYSN